MFRTRTRLVWVASLAVAALVATSAPASAGVSVSIGGSSTWKVTATASTSADNVRVGSRLTGTSNVRFEAKVLGIPLPVTGHYANSFPTTFSRPSLKSADATLNSRTYSQIRNNFLGQAQWEVRGSEGFWGGKTVRITGDAAAATRASSGRFFYAGTISCGSGCTNANAIVRVITS